jgi:antirestriction protein ArdC
MRTNVYDRITGRIVSQLEQGVRPWLAPWNAEHAAGRITRPLRANGIPYRGINVVELWSAAVLKGYAAPIWMTFKQAQELGAHVRKGEQGWQVVYVSKLTRTEADAETGEENPREIPFMRSYIVFNVEQIEGLPPHYYAVAAPRIDAVHRIERAEAFLAATGAAVRHGGIRAYYSISTDHVQMPPFETFRDPESYYVTRAHETTHYAEFRIMPRRTRYTLGFGFFQRGRSA